MRNIIVLLFAFISLPLWSQQRTEPFPEGKKEFLDQLFDLLTMSKTKVMEDLASDLDKADRKGVFSENEIEEIRKMCNQMLELKLSTNPYFKEYIECLLVIKNRPQHAANFTAWHNILSNILKDVENRKFNKFDDFLGFSKGFFELNALRTSPGSHSWLTGKDKYKMSYENKLLTITFEDLDLTCIRKSDSIVIKNTKGVLFPLDYKWQGEDGKVDWARNELKDVFAELGKYEIDLKKNQYEAADVDLTYPLLFPGKKLKGKFIDKVVVENKATEGSYPRFESYDKKLEIKDIGGGVNYTGGFRLEGTSVYGDGAKDAPARILINNSAQKTVYTGEAQLFVIRKGEKLTGDQVRSVIFFADDSIYHQSLNMRFDIKQREMTLERGNRGSDKSPLFDTYHKVDINVDKVKWYINKDSIIFGERSLAIAKPRDLVTFESQDYFDELDYRRIQSIASANPIANLKIAEEQYGKSMDVETVAKAIDPKFSLNNIQSLLYELVEKGFVNYNYEKGMVEVRPKINHFARASQKKVDYDNFSIQSKTTDNNAEWSLRNGNVYAHGVDKLEFSRPQKVALKPLNGELTLKKNRNLDFNGKIFAGFSDFIGRKFSFDYDKFQIQMDSIKYFDLFIQTGEKDKNGNVIANPINSRIEKAFGVLNIDAPANKSGIQNIPAFPSFQSKGLSYVFYDKLDIYDGIYKRDSFYFELDKFSFQGLDSYTAEAIHFNGRLTSWNIFPVFKETLRLQEDQSLGFKTKTPDEGYPNYLGKGIYSGEILLSNAGLQGKGNLQYLRSTFDSEDILFKPRKLTASAELFNIEEGQYGDAVYPKVVGKDVSVDWRPYNDSMFIKTKQTAFTMFRDGEHTFKGLLIMTPKGLKAAGQLNWDKGIADAKSFSFGAFSAKSDTMDLKIRAVGTEDLAFDTRNIKGDLNFEEQKGHFLANSEEISTSMPYNQYKTSMNEFDWDMKEETITFKADPKKPALFQSFAPDQDSLNFRGKTAFYDLKTNLLKIGGVSVIQTCDAYIYPSTGEIEVKKGGEMSPLENAKIVVDTITKFHTINRATVNIKGKKLYDAKGFYQYDIPGKEQEVFFENIIGQRVGKGKKSEKKTLTTAEGTLKDSSNFYLGEKIQFQGKMKLKGNTKNIGFEGFANLESPVFQGKSWFFIDAEIDRKNVVIPFKETKNLENDPVRTGVFLSKSTGQVYPRVMMPTYMRKDRAILDIKGFAKYEAAKSRFVLGDSTKVLTSGLRGNKLTLNNNNGKVDGEGALNIGSSLKFVKVTSAGKIETEFSQLDTTMNHELIKMPAVNVQAMMGIEMIVPEALLTIMINDLRSSTFESNFVDYSKEDFYDKSLAEFIPDDAVLSSTTNLMKLRTLELPKDFKKYTFFFSKLNLKWDPDYESFVTTKELNGLASINGEMINKMVTCNMEVRMPSNEDDRIYIYIKAPNDNYYFFGFSQGILNITSNNTSFTDALLKFKKKDLIHKMPDDETYEIQAVSPETANLFIQRVKSAGTPVKE